MDLGELSHPGDLFPELRIVFHRTGAQGVHPVVDPVNHPRKPGEVPDHIELGDFRQAGAPLPLKMGRKMRKLLVEGPGKIQRRITIRQAPFFAFIDQ